MKSPESGIELVQARENWIETGLGVRSRESWSDAGVSTPGQKILVARRTQDFDRRDIDGP
jgi:hypothetical protein